MQSSRKAFLLASLAYLQEFIKVCLIAAAIIVPVRFFIVQPFYVKGASMEPTFYENEYLIIDELSYRFRDPVRGEVVVFRYPKTEKRYLIKRIVGLPGERVVVRDNVTRVYNQQYPEGFVLNEMSYLDASTYTPDLDVTVGEGTYLALGDHRAVSFDSRAFGPIERSQIVGRAVFRGLPASRAKIIENPLLEN